MEWVKDILIFLKEFGGVSVIAILVVYFITALLKNALPLDRLKERIKKVLILIIIPLSISIMVSLVFLLIEQNYTVLLYIKQVLINWAFSGLAHKILQHYLPKKD